LKQTEFVLPPVVLKEHVVFEIEEKNNTGRKKIKISGNCDP